MEIVDNGRLATMEIINFIISMEDAMIIREKFGKKSPKDKLKFWIHQDTEDNLAKKKMASGLIQIEFLL